MDFAMINLGFLQFDSIPYASDVLEKFDEEQKDANLSEIGIKSGSVVVTQLAIFLNLMFLMIIHLLFFAI
jgi:hypothetical protein